MTKLSILTCTIPERAHYLKRLSDIINPQLENINNVQWLVDPAPKYIPTGTKRNNLINEAKGEYVCFVDDDDILTSNYVSLILEALNSKPDVVTFEGWYTENGRNRVDWVIKLGEKYEARHENGKYMFFRFPNHLSVIKKSIASRVKFPQIHQGEDYAWAVKIQPYLKTSVHIPHRIYHYDYQSNK